MTDQPTPSTPPSPPPPPSPTSPSPRERDDDATSAYTIPERPAPTANVVAEPTAGGVLPTEAAPSGRRAAGVRWAIALGGLVVVIAATAAILFLAGGRPATSAAVGYMPEGTLQYSEYRLDLPGDQRQKLAAFLSKFPGFDDTANVDTKLTEVFDRLIAAISGNTQTYSADIQPWFGGQIAIGNGPITAGSGLSGVMVGTPFGGSSLVVVGITDSAKAGAWLRKTAGQELTQASYGGATIYTIADGGPVPGFVVAVTDKVLLGGADASVRAAIDSKGEGKLADDAEFKAAFGTVAADYVGFAYTEYRAYVQSLLALAGPSSGLDGTTVDEEILALVPAWQSSILRFEDDALVGQSAYPSIPIGFQANNKRSTLAGHAPAGSVAYAEFHDLGAAILPLIDRFRKLPDLQKPFADIDETVGLAGGFEGILGWWGDAGFVVSKNADGSIGGGLLIEPTDAAKAETTLATLRSFLVLGGGALGIELRDVPHGDATITIVDFSKAAGAAGELPPGVKAELAYAVTKDIVVIGYSEAFVTGVLDAGSGSSLADDARYKDLLKRVGEENIGSVFMDISAIRQLVEPLARDQAPAEGWAFYEREILPYVMPIDAFVGSSRVDGGLDHMPIAITVK